MVYSIHTFEMTLFLKKERFDELISEAFEKAKEKKHRVYEKDNVYYDNYFAKKGIYIELHGDFYKKKNFMKKVKFIVNPSMLLGGDDLDLWKPNKSNISELLEKLETCVEKYFDSEYELKDFILTRVDFTVNIQVGSKKNVSAYIEILHKLGRVKGFTQKFDDNENNWYDKKLSFDLTGNSNDIDFTAYDKQGAIENKKDFNRIEAAKGILRIEVRLTKPKAIKKYTNETNISKQIRDLSKKSMDIFLETFARIVPHGDFYKKKQAIEIIEENVNMKKQREKMLCLLELIPKKKSILLAQKELNDRNIDKIMGTFAELNVSPVTISKRLNVKHLKNLFAYLV
jgi:hypothetical protein